MRPFDRRSTSARAATADAACSRRCDSILTSAPAANRSGALADEFRPLHHDACAKQLRGLDHQWLQQTLDCGRDGRERGSGLLLAAQRLTMASRPVRGGLRRMRGATCHTAGTNADLVGSRLRRLGVHSSWAASLRRHLRGDEVPGPIPAVGADTIEASGGLRRSPDHRRGRPRPGTAPL
jgi:hypothetical protein